MPAAVPARVDSTSIFVPEWSGHDTIELQPYYDPTMNGNVMERAADDGDEKEDFEQEGGAAAFGGRHEHLLKSGPLGRCDDPFCTTCPAYIDYSRNLTQAQNQKWKSSFPSEVKSAFLDLVKWRPGIMNPHTKLVQRWNQAFAVCCLIAVFVDPLFFFIFSAKQGYFCIVFNQQFATAVTILRSIFDGIYFIHMLLQFRVAFFEPASRTSRAGNLVDRPRAIAKHYLKGWFFIDLVAVAPLPQMLLWSVKSSIASKGGNANYVKNLLRVIVLLQYIPRMIRVLPLLFGRSQSGFIFETAWANFTINLFIYLLAGHVVGSCWYLFGLQRVNQCLQDTCKIESSVCKKAFLDCGNGSNMQELISFDSNRYNWTKISNASLNCLVNATFSYGIYNIAVPVAMDDNPLHKYIYSLFWGFLQISTLGGNLQPSLFVGEVLFTFGVIGLGLLLFALLIGNMQNFLQSLGRRQLDMQLGRYDVESWMKRRHLSADLQRRVRQAGRLKWASTRGINEELLIDRLPEDLQKDIRRFLCLELVKKVKIFTVMYEEVLDAICERLHEMLFIEGSEVFSADAPVRRMLFIVRGVLGSRGKDSSYHTVETGGFCGEELLIWCLEHTVQASRSTKSNLMKRIGNKAVSTRTVHCLTSVEAFSLEEEDLRYVTEHYSRFMRSSKVQGAIRYASAYFRSVAAERIQAAWRYYARRKLAKSTDSGRHSSGSSDLIRF